MAANGEDVESCKSVNNRTVFAKMMVIFLAKCAVTVLASQGLENLGERLGTC